jgi:dTDP-4-amino-4,6-dideoxygalactose transaminase
MLSRDAFRDIFWAENVLARRYFYPGCHRMQPYASNLSNIAGRLPVTEQLARSVLVLPTGTAVTVDQVEVICGILRLAAARGADVARRLVTLRTAPRLAAQA